MLDQNTDRMWYVIGAVLIGAAIIFGMNSLMPNAFAGVSDNFSQVSENTRLAYFWEPNFKTTGGSYVRKDSSQPRDNRDSSDLFDYQIRFGSQAFSRPDANVYIMDAFNSPNTSYTFSFVGDRYRYVPITYDIYFGEHLVDSITIGGYTNPELQEYSITGYSPKNLEDNNYIKIRSQFDGGPNAFWVNDMSLRVH